MRNRFAGDNDDGVTWMKQKRGRERKEIRLGPNNNNNKKKEKISY